MASIDIPADQKPAGLERQGTNSRFAINLTRSDLAARLRTLRAYASAIMVAAIGCLLSLIAWSTVAKWEEDLAQNIFRKRAAQQVQTLQAGMDDYMNNLSALRAMFVASREGVSRAEFDLFTAGLPDKRKAILTYGWAPRVTAAQRAAHERTGVGDGIAGYHIALSSRNGMFSQAAPAKAEYYPVAYLNRPRIPGNFGVDLQDGGVYQRPLDRARDGDLMAASGNIQLSPGLADRNGFFVALPVYGHGLPHRTVAERRANLTGFVLGSFQFKVMIDAILADMQSSFTYALFETVVAPGDRPGLVHAGGAGKARFGSQSEIMPTGPSLTGAIRTGDRQWRVVVTPAANVSTLLRYNRAWIILFSGLLITALIVAYMAKASRQVRGLRIARERALMLALTDPLTGLANRRAFLERLTASFEAVSRGGAPFAVHLIDMDAFKDVNDIQGHAMGDMLLARIAARLADAVCGETLVARFGGDEFAILQPDVADRQDARALADRIAQAIAAPYQIEGVDLRIAASIGIALHSERVDGPKTILMQADLALYNAKDEGRGCIRFHSVEFDQQVHLRVNLAEELRAGIPRGELELHYQTQVEILTGRIVGLEALVRWNHPVRGMISPAVFIPIAERMGAILPLGQWVLESACKQIQQWRRSGIAVPPLGVNVSGAQLRQAYEFERCVAENFARYGICPGEIELELTESVLMDVNTRECDAIERLQQLGAAIAIDDFGTGYSSLTYLATYPIQRLKIAQELVAGITTDSRSAVVVRSAIRLAQDLGIACIAEGVEREDQARFLLDLGCEHAQGYFYSRPMPAGPMVQLLSEAAVGPGEMRHG